MNLAPSTFMLRVTLAPSTNVELTVETVPSILRVTLPSNLKVLVASNADPAETVNLEPLFKIIFSLVASTPEKVNSPALVNELNKFNVVPSLKVTLPFSVTFKRLKVVAFLELTTNSPLITFVTLATTALIKASSPVTTVTFSLMSNTPLNSELPILFSPSVKVTLAPLRRVLFIVTLLM